MTSWDHCDCKNTEGGTRAVIKGVGNVILIHGLSEACLESLPAGDGGTCSPRQLGCDSNRGPLEFLARLHCRAQTVQGSRSRGMTVLKTVSASPLTLLDTQWGRAGWAIPESESFREETFENTCTGGEIQRGGR